MSTDLPTAISEIRARRLSTGEYLRSVRPPLEGAIFAPDDPLPALVDLPLLALLSAQRVLGPHESQVSASTRWGPARTSDPRVTAA